jgi:hypothetical protein
MLVNFSTTSSILYRGHLILYRRLPPMPVTVNYLNNTTVRAYVSHLKRRSVSLEDTDILVQKHHHDIHTNTDIGAFDRCRARRQLVFRIRHKNGFKRAEADRSG